MKIYAKSREFNTENRIRQLLGQDLWIRIISEGNDYFARFLRIEGDSVVLNCIPAHEVDSARMYASSEYVLSKLRKELSGMDTEFTQYIDWIEIVPDNEIYSSQELYELSGIDAIKITSLDDVVGKDLWVKCEIISTGTAWVKVLDKNDIDIRVCALFTDLLQLLSHRANNDEFEEELEYLRNALAHPETYSMSFPIDDVAIIPPMTYVTTEELERRFHI